MVPPSCSHPVSHFEYIFLPQVQTGLLPGILQPCGFPLATPSLIFHDWKHDDGKVSLRRAIGHALKKFPFRRCVDDVVMFFAFDEILRGVRDGQILPVPAPNFKRGRQTDPPLC